MIFYHEGDCGDVISSLPTVKALGGGDYRIGTGAGASRETMFGTRFESIKPLLLAQPYIHSVEWTFDKRGIDVDFPRFREKYQLHDNLAVAHARYAGVEITLDPWLTAKTCTCDESRPDGGTHFSWCDYGHNSDAPRRPVVARSPRYHHSCFPWRRLLKKHPTAVFVGLLGEWQAFVEAYGPIEYLPTGNLLDLARVIASSSPLLTNQTLSFWLGAGLGVDTILECHLPDLNCIFPPTHPIKYSRTIAELNEL